MEAPRPSNGSILIFSMKSLGLLARAVTVLGPTGAGWNFANRSTKPILRFSVKWISFYYYAVVRHRLTYVNAHLYHYKSF